MQDRSDVSITISNPRFTAPAANGAAAQCMTHLMPALCAAAKILSPGLDAVYIGPADLSFALGLAPRGDNPDPLHMATCDKILAAAHKAGIKCVMHCEIGRAHV